MLNKESLDYDIISEHPERFIECSIELEDDQEIEAQVESLYSKYINLHPEYVRFTHMKPYIENKILKLPFYCLIPYNTYEIKNSYRISCKQHAKFIPNLRKLLNLV